MTTERCPTCSGWTRYENDGKVCPTCDQSGFIPRIFGILLGLNGFARGASWACTTRGRMPAQLRRAYCAPYNSWNNRRATLRFVQDIPLTAADPSYDTVSEIEAGLGLLRAQPLCFPKKITICWLTITVKE